MSGKPKYEISEERLLTEYVVNKRSTESIANEIGCATNTVNYWLQRHGIPLRGQGTHRVHDITGQKFESWTVIKQVDSDPKTKFSRWLCRCACGMERVIHYGSLTTGQRKKCKKCADLAARSPDELTESFWYRVKKGAKSRQIEFDITREESYNKLLEQDRKCALTGMPIFLPQTTKEKDRRVSTASLDRIDSAKGYILDNVQWLHKDVNRMKWKHDEQCFISLCTAVSDHCRLMSDKAR